MPVAIETSSRTENFSDFNENNYKCVLKSVKNVSATFSGVVRDVNKTNGSSARNAALPSIPNYSLRFKKFEMIGMTEGSRWFRGGPFLSL